MGSVASNNTLIREKAVEHSINEMPKTSTSEKAFSILSVACLRACGDDLLRYGLG
jgi:hypothetical protein